jgi:hypothetical protein
MDSVRGGRDGVGAENDGAEGAENDGAVGAENDGADIISFNRRFYSYLGP